MNIYKDGFKPYTAEVKKVNEVTQDFEPPSTGGEPSRVRQSVVNTVVRSRGKYKTKLQPQLTHNPLQRQMMGGGRRTNAMPKKTMIEGPDYDFREINKVLAMDGFAARAMRALIAATLKGHHGNGWRLESHSKRAKTYVQGRLEELMFAVDGTGSMEKFMRNIVTSFVTKSNVIIWLQRKERSKSSKRYEWQGRMHNEIQAVEVVDPSIVDVARSTETRRVKGFNIVTGGTEEVVTFSDCYLLKETDMRQDNLFAQPLITPVLDDILVLRRIEEIHELAIGKATFPLIHVAIGDPKRDPKVYGTAPIDGEIGRTKEVLENQAPEGFLVTPHYYDIKIVQPKSIADFKPYMEYYRDRIIVGLNMDGPSMGLGNTSNRNTATSMSEQLMQKVRDIRSAVAAELNTTLLREILWEGGFMPVGETAVSIVWEDPDPTVRMGWENHYSGLYVSGFLTLNESRQQAGYPPLGPNDEKDLFQYRNEHAKAKFNTTKNQPQNQHGKSAAKPARSKRKDSTSMGIGRALMRAHAACRMAPDSTSGILQSHFAIIGREISRYNDIDIEGQLPIRLGLMQKNLINKVRDAESNKDLTEAFDLTQMSMVAWLEELEETALETIEDTETTAVVPPVEDKEIEDATPSRLHESEPTTPIPGS